MQGKAIALSRLELTKTFRSFFSKKDCVLSEHRRLASPAQSCDRWA
jgi:hypothetical protein